MSSELKEMSVMKINILHMSNQEKCGEENKHGVEPKWQQAAGAQHPFREGFTYSVKHGQM